MPLGFVVCSFFCLPPHTVIVAPLSTETRPRWRACRPCAVPAADRTAGPLWTQAGTRRAATGSTHHLPACCGPACRRARTCARGSHARPRPCCRRAHADAGAGSPAAQPVRSRPCGGGQQQPLPDSGPGVRACAAAAAQLVRAGGGGADGCRPVCCAACAGGCASAAQLL